jgi:hypothetical protein
LTRRDAIASNLPNPLRTLNVNSIAPDNRACELLARFEVYDNGDDEICAGVSEEPEAFISFVENSVMSVFGNCTNLTPEDSVADNRVEQH